MIDFIEIKKLFNIEKGSLQSTKCTEGEYNFITASSEWKTHNEYTHDQEALIIAVSASGSLGRVHYVNGKFISSDLCFILTPKSKEHPVDLSFYYYIFRSIRDDLVKSTATGTSKLAINKTNFGKYKLPYVDITKQRSFKNKLINVAERKDKLTNINEEQWDLLQALRQQILQDAITGKLSESWRATNLKNSKNKTSALNDGTIAPEIWENLKLDKVADFFNGKAHEPFVTKDGKYVLVNSKFVSNSGNAKLKLVSDRLTPLQKSDIAFVMSDVPNGRALARTYLVEQNNKYTLNQRICGFTVNKRLVLPEFLNLVLDRNKYFLGFNDGKKQTNLRKNQILGCSIPVPSLEEQQYIISKIDTLLILIRRLEVLNSETQNNIDYINQVILKELYK